MQIVLETVAKLPQDAVFSVEIARDTFSVFSAFLVLIKQHLSARREFQQS